MIWHPFTPQLGGETPLKIVRAEREYLYDANGRDYVDAISSWWTMIHGHNHPAIIGAIKAQLDKLDHVLLAGFTHEPAEQLAAKLIETTGGIFSHVLYSDNGSTAVEIMLKLAVQYWRNTGEPEKQVFIKFDANYHGDTVGAMSLGGDSVFTRAFAALLFETRSFSYPTEGNQAEFVLSELEIYLQQHADCVAAIVLEPLIAAAGGMVFQSTATLQRIGELAAEYNVLLLFDEVFTGMGRTGEMFALQFADVKPDMVAVAKGLTGGALPLAVTLVSEKIHSAFVSEEAAKTFYHGHTMSGNPPGCAAALASFNLFESENSLKQVSQLQARMEEAWRRLLQRFPGKLADARALGAVSAANLVSRGEEPGYVFSAAKQFRQICREQGVILRPLGNVIYVTPPYNISDSALDRVFLAIAAALAEYRVE